MDATVFHHWLFHPMFGRGYQFYSGVGADLGYLGVVALVAKHFNCHEPRCLRLGHRHPDHGFPVCRKHYHRSLQLEG